MTTIDWAWMFIDVGLCDWLSTGIEIAVRQDCALKGIVDDEEIEELTEEELSREWNRRTRDLPGEITRREQIALNKMREEMECSFRAAGLSENATAYLNSSRN